MLAAAEPAVRRCQRRILAPLAASERDEFMRMLDRLVASNNEFSRAPMGEKSGRGARKAPARTLTRTRNALSAAKNPSV